jgi:NADPH:quinone reductase-like Zn-dependent oxidoreductase
MFRRIATLLAAASLSHVGFAAAPHATMLAAVVTDGKVQIQSVPLPEPAAGQVRVRVRAASVNPVDWKLADRAAPGSAKVPGRDFAGVIDALGPEVQGWKPGDAVIGLAIGGAYAQYALASVKAIAHKPRKLSFAEASGIPAVGEAAWRAMVVIGNVQKGQRVLIHGGAGGVGSSAVQIAKARGAYVIATASARNQAFLRSLGADETIDYTTTRFEDKVKDVDVVLNTVNPEISARSIGVVKPGGILVSVVGLPQADKCEAAHIRCAVTGPVSGEMLPMLSALADAGKFHLNVEQRLPLAKANQAWDANRAGHTRGKIILIPPN